MDGRYKSHLEYKTSGIEWVDLIPSHWKKANLRWTSNIYSGGTPSKTVEEYWENGTVPWLNSGEVNQGIITHASTYITEDAYRNSSAKWIPKKALVMALAGQGKTKGMVAQLAIGATCNQSMAAIIPNNISDSKYLFWWLTSNYQNIRNMAGGDLRDGLNLELLGSISYPDPPENEKKLISNFLEHETAKIDALIEKQKRLIQLLKEKRQAVINHAVTKGLNPKAKMRNSGIEWLGNIPEHWDVSKVKRVVEMAGRIGYRGYTVDDIVDEGDGAIVLSPSNINDRGFSLEKKVFLSWDKYFESPEIMLEPGDIILVKTSWSFGKVAVVSEIHSPMTINPQMVLLKKHKIDSRYISHFLTIDALQARIFMINTGSYMPTMTQENIGELPIFVPPKSEAIEIANFIQERCIKFNALLDMQDSFVELLQERRIALISAAVTGKIDVRDWGVPQASSTNKEVTA